jgi:hypothetical protein
LNFSVDDIGARFEYQRKDAKWSEVVENMKKYISQGGYTAKDVIECKVCCSVTNMNVYYFPEYFDFMNSNFPGLPVYWNLIYEPWEYSIEILPNEVKDIVRTRLKDYVQTTYKMDKKRTKTVEDLIIYLNNSIGKDFSGFFEKIERHDRFRKESFEEVFPEFWGIIKQHKQPVTATVKEKEFDNAARGNSKEGVDQEEKNESVNSSITDYKLAFHQMMEKFEAWGRIKPKIDELENLAREIEPNHQIMYRRLYNAPATAIISSCETRSTAELFELYKSQD